jgi:phosphoserine phosphatase
MEPIKFRQEFSKSGAIYYEPANEAADEVMDFIGTETAYSMFEPKAERIFAWLEKLGHDVVIINDWNYMERDVMGNVARRAR